MRNFKFAMIVLAGAGMGGALAQTQVDLRLQSKDVDFSGAVSTSPMKTGTAFPATCTTGQMFFLLSAAAGTNLYGCTSTNTWTLESGGSGGSGGSSGGSGAGSNATLPDFMVAATSTTVLTIGGTCTNTAPCNARFGNTVYSVIQSALATISAGSGTAYIYLMLDGSVNVGSSLTVSCLRCNAVSGITGFPPNSIPLATWAASGGAWVSTAGVDVRSFQSTYPVVPQAGIVTSTAPGQTLVGVDTTVVGLQVVAPATSSTACTQGSWATNGTYYYLCTSSNTWMRVALSSF